MAHEIISVILVDGEVHVIKRAKSHMMYACSPPKPVPDRVWKEIYSADVEHGKVYLDRTLEGKHLPAITNPEKFIFEEGGK